MITYTYTRELTADGIYNTDSQNKLNEKGEGIDIFSEIYAIFPKNITSIQYKGTNIYVNFQTALSDSDKTVLDNIFTTHKDYVISNIENINANWEETYTDYKKARYDIMVAVAIKGFDTLTQTEKLIAAKWFVVVAEDRNKVYSISDQIQFGKAFHINSTKARAQRIDAAISTCFNLLNKVDADSVINDTLELVSNYINYGREGTLSGDPIGLFDYLQSVAGTPYEGVGLLNKPIAPIGMTNLELSNRLIDILKNGNY